MSANISGPIKRNKTFFLFGWQRHHERSGNNKNADVPSPAMLDGDFSFPQSSAPADIIYDPDSLVQLPNGSYSRTPFPNNRIPQNRFDPAAVKFLSLNPFSGENNRNNQTFYNSTGPHQNLSTDTDKNSYRTGIDAKIDHSFSANHKIFGRYSNARHRSMSGTWQMPVGQPRSRLHWRADSDRPAPDSDLRLLRHQSTDHQRGAAGLEPAEAHTAPRKSRRELGSEIRHPQCRAGNNAYLPERSTGGQWSISAFRKVRRVDVNENASLQNNLSMIRGQHTFKTGYEILRTQPSIRIWKQRPSGTYRLGGTEFPFTPNTGHPFAIVSAGHGHASRLHQGAGHLAAAVVEPCALLPGRLEGDQKPDAKPWPALADGEPVSKQVRAAEPVQSHRDRSAHRPAGRLAASHWARLPAAMPTTSSLAWGWPTTSGRTGCSGAASPSTRSTCG